MLVQVPQPVQRSTVYHSSHEQNETTTTQLVQHQPNHILLTKSSVSWLPAPLDGQSHGLFHDRIGKYPAFGFLGPS